MFALVLVLSVILSVVIMFFFCFVQIKMDVPVTLGFCILQLAKKRMLEFYYDLMNR